MVDIDSTEEVISLFEVEIQKPRNLSASEREDREPLRSKVYYNRIKKDEVQGKYVTFVTMMSGVTDKTKDDDTSCASLCLS